VGNVGQVLPSGAATVALMLQLFLDVCLIWIFLPVTQRELPHPSEANCQEVADPPILDIISVMRI